MSVKEYTVLKDFSVSIINNKGKTFTKNFETGITFKVDPTKKYKPTVDELTRKGKIQVKMEEENLQPTDHHEQEKPNEQQTSKQPFYRNFLSGRGDSKEERGNSVKIDQELLRLIDGILEEKLNDKFGELYNGYQTLTNQNQDLKSELGKLANHEEFVKTNQKIDSITKLVEKYPQPITLNDLNTFLKPALESMPETTRNLDEKLHRLPRRIKSDFEEVIETQKSYIASSVNKNSERVNQISNSINSSFSQMDSKISQLPGKIGDTVTLQLDDTSKNISRIKSLVNETKETVEELQGKTTVLEDLKSKLDKVNITQKLEPFNHEDDVIIELSEQAQLILDQLTLASRNYVAQSKEIERLKAENEKLKQEHEQIEAMTTKKVEQLVRKEVTKQMLTEFAGKFTNLDDVYSDEKLKGIQALFTNHGLVRSEELKVGEQIHITNENRKDYEPVVTFEYKHEGYYLIEESQFVWKDTNIAFKKAKAVKAPEKEVVEETKESDVMNEMSNEDDASTNNSVAEHKEELLNNKAIENEQPAEEQPAEEQPTELSAPHSEKNNQESTNQVDTNIHVKEEIKIN
ncbi:hypothetical protein [Neobacillus sp. Marseille-QA0830]